VARLLRMADPPKPADAADALALAICHLWRAGTTMRFAAAAAAAAAPAAGAVPAAEAAPGTGAAAVPRISTGFGPGIGR
jgi:crossover junction endodeoxyribonuclease RuvC